MAALKISKKHHTRRHQPYDLPTWRQIKKPLLIKQKIWFLNRECLRILKIFLSLCLLCLLLLPPAQADLINHTYWAYIPNSPLLQVVEWTDIGPVVSTNDSVHMPPPWSLEGPSHPEEEGRLTFV